MTKTREEEDAQVVTIELPRESFRVTNWQELEKKEYSDILSMRRVYGAGLLILVGFQILVTACLLIARGLGRLPGVSDTILIAYLGQHFGQVVGLAYIVTRFLFGAR